MQVIQLSAADVDRLGGFIIADRFVNRHRSRRCNCRSPRCNRRIVDGATVVVHGASVVVDGANAVDFESTSTQLFDTSSVIPGSEELDVMSSGLSMDTDSRAMSRFLSGVPAVSVFMTSEQFKTILTV